MTLLDQFVPEFEFDEYHEIRIRAPLPVVYAAIKETTLADMSLLVSALFALRGLPARIAGRRGLELPSDVPLLEAMAQKSFVALGEVPCQEIVTGTIGQPWKLTLAVGPTIPDAEAFRRFDKPEYARIGMNLMVVPDPSSGQVICSTTTRVRIPDPAARRRFASYWRVISFGSGLIRRLWLRAIKRRAERNATGR